MRQRKTQKSATGIGKIDRRQKLVEVNKELILDAAAMLFGEKGYHEISLDEIAASLGATKGLVYHYYKSKGEVLGNIRLRHQQRFHKLMLPFLSGEFESVEEQFRQIAIAHMTFTLEYEYTVRMIYRNLDMRDCPPDLRRQVLDYRRTYFVKFRSFVQQIMEKGVMPNVNLNLATNVIIWSFDMVPMFYSQSRLSVEEMANMMVDLYIHAIVPGNYRKKTRNSASKRQHK
jgi:AcrR family transcriptional regulator